VNDNNVQKFDWNDYETLYSYPPYLLKIVQSIAGIILFSFFFFFYVNPVKLQLQGFYFFMQIMAITVLKDVRNVFYSGFPHMRESGFQNLGKFCLCNLESWALESGIQFKESGIRSPSSTTKNLGSGIHNPRVSSIPLHWVMW